MSRDVAYRNGYLPLFAGAELVRRSGALTQFPAENLIGTLPTFGGFKYRAPTELVGQPVQFGMPNSLYDQYQRAAGFDPEMQTQWPFTGFSPAGVVPEVADYLRLKHYRELVQFGPLEGVYVPGTHVGVYTDFGEGVINEPYSSTLTVSGLSLATPGAVYPSGLYNTVDEYMAACGMPSVPNDGSEVFRQTHTLEWLTPDFAGSTAVRATMTGRSSGTAGFDASALWVAFFVPARPYPPELFDPENTLQGLYGNIDMVYAQIWSAADADLTDEGLLAKGLLRSLSPAQPIGILGILGLATRDPSTLTPAEVAYLESVGVTDVSLLPGTTPRQGIGFVGPSYKMITVETLREQRVAGVWSETAHDFNTLAGLTAANTNQRLFSFSNQLVTYLFLPTAQVEQVFIPGN